MSEGVPVSDRIEAAAHALWSCDCDPWEREHVVGPKRKWEEVPEGPTRDEYLCAAAAALGAADAWDAEHGIRHVELEGPLESGDVRIVEWFRIVSERKEDS